MCLYQADTYATSAAAAELAADCESLKAQATQLKSMNDQLLHELVRGGGESTGVGEGGGSEGKGVECWVLNGNLHKMVGEGEG